MAGGIEFKKVDGVYSWYDKVTGEKLDPESLTKHDLDEPSFVQQDTLKQELRHPVTGVIMNSLSAWNRVNKELGLECVGNDLLSKKKRTVQDKVTDEMILDRIEKAESILSDPAKKRAYDNQQLERLERHNKMFNGNHRYLD